MNFCNMIENGEENSIERIGKKASAKLQYYN
jgi:hypothetical protein